VAPLVRINEILVIAYAASLPLSLTLSWVLLIAGLATWAAARIIDRAGRHGRPWQLPPLALPLAVFLLLVFISGAAAGGLPEGLKSLFSLKQLVVYFWAFDAFSCNRNLIPIALQTILAISGVSGVWAAVQQLTGFHPFGYPYLQGTGFLGGPMPFAGQMQVFSLLCLALFFARAYSTFALPLSRLPAFVLVAAANFAGVFFASERSAWLGAAAGAIAATGLLGRRAAVACLAALVVIAAVSWVTVPVVRQRIEPLLTWQNDISARVRLRIWRDSIDYWRQSPYFGVGIRRFPHFDIPEAIVPGRSKDLNHAHSNYVHILTTTGLAGLVAYLWLWFAAAGRALGAFKTATAPFEKALALGVFGGTVALMVSGAFEYNFGTSQVRLAQWFVLAMLPASTEVRRQPDPQEPPAEATNSASDG
jgi:O-antigen ligase